VGQEVAIYLPAGYDESGLHALPGRVRGRLRLFSLWNSAIHVQATLDSLIQRWPRYHRGLFVFMNGGRRSLPPTPSAPISFDGSEKMTHLPGP